MIEKIKSTPVSVLKPVLYVEDEENDVFLVRIAMKRAGIDHPLTVLSDGRQAVEYLRGDGQYADRITYPRPCMLLLDVNLPGFSGLEVLEWVRQKPEYDKTPVVMFSSSELDQDRKRAKELGADDYIVKPTDIFKLWEILRQLRDKWIVPHCGETSPRLVARVF